MGKFSQGGRGGRGGFGGGGFNKGGRGGFNKGGRDGGRPTMHRATCSECGDSCEVPFRPTGDKPVLCSACFGQSKGKFGDRDRNFEKRSFGHDSFGDKKMFKATCSECGDSCEVPFRPTGDKPVFCSNCFGQGAKGQEKKASTNNSGQFERQLQAIDRKLDDILASLSLSNPKKAVKEEKTPTKPEVKKAIAEKAKPKVSKKPVTKKVVKKKK